MRKLKQKHRWLIKHLPLLIACAGFMSSPVHAENVEPEDATGNQVEINESSYSINGETEQSDGSLERVYGGGNEENSEDAADNSVGINGGTITEGAFGGMSSIGDALRNKVTVRGGTIQNIIGGATYFDFDNPSATGAFSAGNVQNNYVEINDGTVENVSGGEVGMAFSKSGTTSYNDFAIEPVVSGNRVVINDGSISNVNGGAAIFGSIGGNSVEVNGGSIGGGVLGGFSTFGTVNENSVKITGGSIENAIGGASYFDAELQNTPGDVTNNTVEVSGGTIGYVSGGEIGYTALIGDSASFESEETPLVKENRVIIHPDGKITGGVYGGVAYSGAVTDNIIEIDGGTIGGEIIGGWLREPSGSYSIYNNKIEIGGSPDLTDAYLIGGLIGELNESFNDSNFYYGDNTLNIKTTGVVAKNIGGFKNINFNLPASATASDEVLTLTEGTTNLNGVYLTVSVNDKSPIDTNDRIKLITNTDGGLNFRLANGNLASASDLDDDFNGDVDEGYLTYSNEMNRSAEVYHDLTLTSDGNGLIAEVGERHNRYVPPPEPPDPIPIPNPLPDPGDHTEGEPSTPITEQVQDNRGFEMFGNFGGGHFKYKTGNGSCVKSDSSVYDFGFARHFIRDNSVLTFAPVIEYGHGSYDTYPSAEKALNGHGKQNYIAGGLVVRSINNSGFYYEGSLRAGSNDTKYHSDSYVSGDTTNHISYHSKTPILTGHIRVGNQTWFKRNLLDVYGICALSHQNSVGVNLNSGTHIRFGSADVGRLRIGYRMTSRLSSVSQLYTGMAYQFDMHSDSKMTSGGETTTSSGKDGSSGMLEIGWLVKPIKDNPWALDINTTGWIGLQEGFTAMAKIKRSF